MPEWDIWERRFYYHTVEAETLEEAIEIARTRNGNVATSDYTTANGFSEDIWADDDNAAFDLSEITNPEWPEEEE